ncbi:MAG TPA: tetratricopeptide repeat protein, partial [Herpetosiphonaceae bacterium]|nr:tetratricopeptide repeat protein [Herpetosiphonaceae bacterium]
MGRTHHRTSRLLPWYRTRGGPGLIALALIGLLAALLLLMNYGALRPGQAAPSSAFVVRIAPFEVEGGDRRTGQIVAEQLRAELEERLTTAVDLDILHGPVGSPEAALEAARDAGAEVVIWGTTQVGGSATSPTLRPRLFWLPDDPWEPRDWQGYDGHLVLPQQYDLALAPFNGAAVLPGLIDSLVLFSRGDADYAAERLATLERDYGDVLRAELPAALRAAIFWAQGLLPDSTAEARRALAAMPRAEHRNNLGALLLDQQQNAEARQELLEAIAADPHLIAARANLARLLMNEGRPAEALPDLRTAAQVDPRPVVLATLAEAFRRSGQLESAREALEEVLAVEPNNGPALVERALLALTPVLTTTGRLEWELERTPQRSTEQLDAIRAEAGRGIALIEALRVEHLRRATAYGAAGRPEMQRLMEMQARRLAEELVNRRSQLVVVMIEQGRLHQGKPRSSARRLWDALSGKRTPLEEAAILADALARQTAGGAIQYDLLYQRGRAAYLGADHKTGQQAWDAADALVAAAPPGSTLAMRPEAAFGKARLLLDGAQRPEARAELERALAMDERFFPARRLLLNIAQEDGRWADAESHLRWFAEHRSSAAVTIELATALREQGRLDEAEALLLPLANRDDPESLVLLGRMYREAGQLDAADTVLGRALAAAPNGAAALEEQALVELARLEPRYDVAEDLLRRAVTADPSRTSAHVELGKLLANVLGRPGDAARSFQAAVELKSDDPVTYRELGETLLRSG